GAGTNTAKSSFFQVGQRFADDRLPASEAIGDPIDTEATTQGYVSRGNSFGLTIYGAQRSQNDFLVYTDAAPRCRHCGDSDDRLTLQAFRLAGVAGDAGYLVNAPVHIDGGGGIDDVNIVGTEDADAFVVTQDDVRGAGLNAVYQHIERIQLDAREGNDH